MKIYKIPLSSEVRPQSGFIAPAHNQDYGIEQDFDLWLSLHSKCLTSNPDEADWFYFGPFFNRYYCSYWGERMDVIESAIMEIDPDRPTFTIAEYDLRAMHPDFDFRNLVIFTGSRRDDNGSIDVPLLCSRHQDISTPTGGRTWRASFMGKFETSGYREAMRQALAGREDVLLMKSAGSTDRYIQLMADSWLALAPRGFGGQSFRFYEALQFGTIPVLIGDLDTRPFPQYIDWSTCSLFTDDPARLPEIIDSLGQEDLQAMSREARQMFNQIHYQNWCHLVIRWLNEYSRI